MDRRELLALGATAAPAAIGLSNNADAQEVIESCNPKQLDDWGFVGQENDPDYGPILAPDMWTQGRPTGRGRSRHEDVIEALRIILNVPKTESPYEVAKYFHSLDGKHKKFKKEWDKAANPLIVNFFASTQTLPSGDVTPWCAAFMNFCIFAAGKSGTSSALSGSFRKNLGKKVRRPQEGDIAVFWANGDRGDKGFGHVGFFVSANANSVSTLGGNQSNGIAISEFKVPGKYKRVQYVRI